MLWLGRAARLGYMFWLKKLKASGCRKLKSIQLSGCFGIRELDVSGCPDLEEIPGIEDLWLLEKLKASGCGS